MEDIIIKVPWNMNIKVLTHSHVGLLYDRNNPCVGLSYDGDILCRTAYTWFD